MFQIIALNQHEPAYCILACMSKAQQLAETKSPVVTWVVRTQLEANTYRIPGYARAGADYPQYNCTKGE